MTHMDAPPTDEADALADVEMRLWLDLQAGEFERVQAAAARLLIVSTDRSQRGRVEAALGIMLQRAGLMADAREQFTRALDLVAGNQADEATFLAVSSLSNVLGGDLPGAAQQAARALDLGRQSGAWFAVRQARTTMAAVHLGEGYPQLALAEAQHAASFEDPGLGQAEYRSTAHVLVGMALAELDRMDEAHAAIAEGIRLGQEEGDTGQLSWYLASQALLHFIDGTWEKALGEARESLATAERTGALAPRPLAWGIWANIEGLRGNTSVAWDLIERARRNRMGPHGGLGEEWVALAITATSSDRSQRYDALCEAWFRLRGVPYLLAWRMFAHSLVLAALARGDHAVARVVTQGAVTGAERAADIPSARATALCCEGSLTGSIDKLTEGIELLREARRPFPFALACHEGARVLCDQGAYDQAIALLRDAGEVYHAFRAARLSAAVGRDLTSAVAALGRRANRPEGWERLTPAERKVALLAAKGHTNPQIAEQLVVSARTVQTHMAHLTAKLGVRSRVQLAACLGDIQPD